ncbi:hypothetical protein OSTOST_03550 [Ostertagia ostertagi]
MTTQLLLQLRRTFFTGGAPAGACPRECLLTVVPPKERGVQTEKEQNYEIFEHEASGIQERKRGFLSYLRAHSWFIDGDHARSLGSDCACLLILTPLTIGGTVLCIRSINERLRVADEDGDFEKAHDNQPSVVAVPGRYLWMITGSLESSFVWIGYMPHLLCPAGRSRIESGKRNNYCVTVALPLTMFDGKPWTAVATSGKEATSEAIAHGCQEADHYAEDGKDSVGRGAN